MEYELLIHVLIPDDSAQVTVPRGRTTDDGQTGSADVSPLASQSFLETKKHFFMKCSSLAVILTTSHALLEFS